jgi:hypothetical protein
MTAIGAAAMLMCSTVTAVGAQQSQQSELLASGGCHW